MKSQVGTKQATFMQKGSKNKNNDKTIGLTFKCNMPFPSSATGITNGKTAITIRKIAMIVTSLKRMRNEDKKQENNNTNKNKNYGKVNMTK